MPWAEGQPQTAYPGTAGRRILERRGTKRRRSDGVGHEGTCLRASRNCTAVITRMTTNNA